MIDLKFNIIEDWDGKLYKSKIEELRQKIVEKNRKRPMRMKKKDWKKKDWKKKYE